MARVHRERADLHYVRSAMWAGVLAAFVLLALAAAGYA